jgi:outer membrane protein OmpA-like peptidoglycan-associated protein
MRSCVLKASFFTISILLSAAIFARKPAYMSHTYVAIREQVNEADVRLINDTIRVLFPHNLMFDVGKSQIRPEFIPVMNRLARVLQEHSKTAVLLVGHSDKLGREDLNLALSRRRADSARLMLERQDVAPSRLESWGLGSRMPVAQNDTEAGRKRNRCVEFVILFNYRDGGRL